MATAARVCLRLRPPLLSTLALLPTLSTLPCREPRGRAFFRVDLDTSLSSGSRLWLRVAREVRVAETFGLAARWPDFIGGEASSRLTDDRVGLPVILRLDEILGLLDNNETAIASGCRAGYIRDMHGQIAAVADCFHSHLVAARTLLLTLTQHSQPSWSRSQARRVLT